MRVYRLIEAGSVSIIAVVHIDDMFAVGRKVRWDWFCVDVDSLILINNLDKLQMYAFYHNSRNKVAGSLTI